MKAFAQFILLAGVAIILAVMGMVIALFIAGLILGEVG